MVKSKWMNAYALWFYISHVLFCTGTPSFPCFDVFDLFSFYGFVCFDLFCFQKVKITGRCPGAWIAGNNFFAESKSACECEIKYVGLTGLTSLSMRFIVTVMQHLSYRIVQLSCKAASDAKDIFLRQPLLDHCIKGSISYICGNLWIFILHF